MLDTVTKSSNSFVPRIRMYSLRDASMGSICLGRPCSHVNGTIGKARATPWSTFRSIGSVRSSSALRATRVGSGGSWTPAKKRRLKCDLMGQRAAPVSPAPRVPPRRAERDNAHSRRSMSIRRCRRRANGKQRTPLNPPMPCGWALKARWRSTSSGLMGGQVGTVGDPSPTNPYCDSDHYGARGGLAVE
jgi:hypothetical protein